MNTILESFLTIGTVKIFIPLVPPPEQPQVPPQVQPLVPLLVPSKVTTQHLRCYMHVMLFYRTQVSLVRSMGPVVSTGVRDLFET